MAEALQLLKKFAVPNDPMLDHLGEAFIKRAIGQGEQGIDTRIREMK